MNTFEQLTGKVVWEILRVDCKEDYDDNSIIALFLRLDTDSGLYIENGSDEMVTLQYILLEELREDFETEYQTHLNNLKATDELNKFIVGKIHTITLGRQAQDKFVGESFVISSSEYSEVQIMTEDLTVTISQKNGRQDISIKQNP